MAEFITVSTYNNPLEAEIAANLLEDADISTFLKDKELISQNPLLANATGGIKLQVHVKDQSKAEALLITIRKSKTAQPVRIKLGNLIIVTLIMPFLLPVLLLLLVIRPQWYPDLASRVYIILFGVISIAAIVVLIKYL